MYSLKGNYDPNPCRCQTCPEESFQGRISRRHPGDGGRGPSKRCDVKQLAYCRSSSLASLRVTFLSIIVNPLVARMAPIFSKLVSKFWKLVSKRKYALKSRKYALTPRKYHKLPENMHKHPKNNFLKNIVTRFLNNFRIYGTPPSPGVYNDTNIWMQFFACGSKFPACN